MSCPLSGRGKLWAAIVRELLRRDVVRTANNPIGDIAEAVVTEHYNGERRGFQQLRLGRYDLER